MTSDAPGPSGILGSLHSEDGRGVVRVHHRYDTDIDDLWAAITDPARLARLVRPGRRRPPPWRDNPHQPPGR